MLRAIKIIHSWNQIKEYRFLSDYFRMMGIYICGYTPQTDCLSSDFDVVIILKKDMDKNDVEMLEERYPKAIKQVFNVDKTKLNDKYPYGKPQTDEVARGSGNREYGCRRLREKLPNFSGVSFF